MHESSNICAVLHICYSVNTSTHFIICKFTKISHTINNFLNMVSYDIVLLEGIDLTAALVEAEDVHIATPPEMVLAGVRVRATHCPCTLGVLGDVTFPAPVRDIACWKHI